MDWGNIFTVREKLKKRNQDYTSFPWNYYQTDPIRSLDCAVLSTEIEHGRMHRTLLESCARTQLQILPAIHKLMLHFQTILDQHGGA